MQRDKKINRKKVFTPSEKKSPEGFTLIELLVAIIIVGALSAMAVPIFRQNIRRVMATEGHAMVGAIRTAQRIYFAEYNRYTNNWADLEQNIDINNNKYFKTMPSILAGGTGHEANFTATIIGSGDAADIKISINHEGVITVTGL